MSIRKKIFLGCAVVAFILFLAGIAIAFEMQRIRSSVSVAVAENIKSMNVAHNMQQFFHNQNMIVLDYISEKNDSLLLRINVEAANYETTYSEAQKWISVDGERQILDSLNVCYSGYKQALNALMRIVKSDRKDLFLRYYKDFHKNYDKVLSLLDELFLINKKAIENNSLLVNDNYYRMIMPAIIAILTCIILIFLLNYFIYIYFISPMLKIMRGVNAFTETRVPYNIEIDTGDEIATLNNEVKKLTELTKKYEKENTL